MSAHLQIGHRMVYLQSPIFVHRCSSTECAMSPTIMLACLGGASGDCPTIFRLLVSLEWGAFPIGCSLLNAGSGYIRLSVVKSILRIVFQTITEKNHIFFKQFRCPRLPVAIKHSNKALYSSLLTGFVTQDLKCRQQINVYSPSTKPIIVNVKRL